MFLPLPSSSPTYLFLECFDPHVTTRSPIPASPEKVCSLAFTLLPSLIISAKPLVIIAALVLSPKPIPSDIPDIIAITFFVAPPSSTPTMSSFV